MFERYTEHARRAIFFARYEASMFGSEQITSGELLLGILREHNALAMRIGIGVVESIRNELQPLSPPKQKVSTSVDLPLSNESKRALAYGAEEADALGHKHIDAPHLLLGLMRLEESLAAQLLWKHGIKYAEFRKIVAQEGLAERKTERPAAWQEPLAVAPQAKVLEPAISALRQLVDNTSARLREYSDAYGDQPLKRKPWTRKEALGNLIDWAMLHRQWVIRALMESKLKATEYPDEAAVAIQRYAEFPWSETVDLWVSLNRLLIHLLLRVPEDKVDLPCRIGIAEPISLAELVEAYVKYCEDIVGQILARL